MTKEVLKRLVKIGHFSDWFGLVSGYNLRKVADKANLWGYIGSELWSKKALKAVIDPYRNFALQKGFDEKTIDQDLQYFASKARVTINQVRRVYYQIEVEPEEKPEKLAEEAEEEIELPEFEEEAEEE